MIDERCQCFEGKQRSKSNELTASELIELKGNLPLKTARAHDEFNLQLNIKIRNFQ